MANKQGLASLGPYILRMQTGKLFAPNDVASDIKNFYATPEGTLRAVWGPASLIDNDGVRPTSTTIATDKRAVASGDLGIQYGKNMHGVFHATLQNGERDVLLLHTGNEIWEFAGWLSGWRQLVADTAPTYGVSAQLIDNTQPQFPTQFESTGNGVVIVPQGGRAYFYDGITLAPLGFAQRPSPPTGRGPTNSSNTVNDRGVGINDRGYAHDGTPYKALRVNYQAGITEGFGLCRVGTTSNLTFDSTVFGATSGTTMGAANAGWLIPGEYRCRVQFIDKFGNLSALSPPSDGIKLSFQPSEIPNPTGSGSGDSELVGADSMLKQIAWTGIPLGPDHCIGRILYRTKDLINSGSSDYFRHTQNAMGVSSDFATLPDNETRIYPDNIPDAFLITKAQEYVPVPLFRLCRLAYGRLWVANIEDSPGLLRPSVPGRYGTFPANQELYPDPAGGEITGLWRANRGLLAFTRSGSFVVEPSDDGQRFKSSVLSSQVGCEAPSSLATLDDGRTIWLGRDGFYTYDGVQITFASHELREFFKQVTPSRLKQAVAAYDLKTKEYRCWVSDNGRTQNTTCFIYDGTGWRRRKDVNAASVCVTQDHRQLMITAGKVRSDDDSHAGVFVLDHAPSPDDNMLSGISRDRSAVIETAWMQSQQYLTKNTARTVYLWLRETENSDVTITVFRDWRETTVETATLKRYAGDDVPNFYESTTLGPSSDAKFVSRRPYWTRAAVYVPSSDTFKFKIEGTGDWEFVGLQVDVAPRAYGGAMVPP